MISREEKSKNHRNRYQKQSVPSPLILHYGINNSLAVIFCFFGLQAQKSVLHTLSLRTKYEPPRLERGKNWLLALIYKLKKKPTFSSVADWFSIQYQIGGKKLIFTADSVALQYYYNLYQNLIYCPRRAGILFASAQKESKMRCYFPTTKKRLFRAAFFNLICWT